MSITDIPEALQRQTMLIERGLADLFAQRTLPLYQLMEYQLGWRGEMGDPIEFPQSPLRLYGSLCALTCEVFAGEASHALPAAIATELVQQFIQIHEDIQEGSQVRYNRPTVWWIWGPAQAINAGDGLHALARLSLLQLDGGDASSELTVKNLQTLDGASLRMCEGMYVDMEYQERVEVFPASYLNMARDKTGALVGCALELGARSGGATDEASDALRTFGEELGVAYQVQEDIRSLWSVPFSGKISGLDVLNKKKGYPVLLAMDEAPISIKRELGTLFFKRVLEPADIRQVTSILERLNARERAQEAAQEIFDNAVTRLQQTPVRAPPLDDLFHVGRWLASEDTRGWLMGPT